MLGRIICVGYTVVVASAALAHRQSLQVPLQSPNVRAAEERWTLPELKANVEEALDVMQSNFFQTWLGQWPTSIDWTGAVVGTHVTATLSTLSRSSNRTSDTGEGGSCDRHELHVEHLVNKYFAQIIAYYFGENAFGLRTQAHDDMLWVVLGWLESLKLIRSHQSLHPSGSGGDTDGPAAPNSSHPWHGTQFVPAFAHRSRVFYDIVSKAWDRELCGGGLTWNPNLDPYKNAVTNTQFISAAVGMYLYHPGDTIGSPFMSFADRQSMHASDGFDLPPTRAHDPLNLQIAKEAHAWLEHINMTNEQGLFVDGFHVSNRYDPDKGRVIGSCDLRNEMVYTYNQGVILSGRRQLWEATGNTSYLQQGHELVGNVVSSTGFPGRQTGWKGLGYSGLLTELCDSQSTCNQDGQTFKGIFFHHLASFCEPLPTEEALMPGTTFLASHEDAALHASSCSSYIPWVERNAEAAWKTRNDLGIMGAWWGAPTFNAQRDVALPRTLPVGAVDWRNARQDVRGEADSTSDGRTQSWDLNDRGRGRTVESHSGGLAVLRALYALRTFYG